MSNDLLPQPNDVPEDPYTEENNRLEKILDTHASILAEHFESVRIVGVVNRGDGAYARISRGQGNYFSQYGSIRDWLVEQEESTRNSTRE